MAPWEKYGGAPTTPAPAPSTERAPGVIVGRPKAPDPYKVEQDRINNSNEAERLRLAQDAAKIAAEKAALDIEKAKKAAAAGPMGDAREGEANNAAFYGRGRKALDEYNVAEAQLGGPRSAVGGAIAALPGGQTLLRALPDNVGDSPERRQAERAKLDFINVIVRSDSGAAVPEDEIARAARTYFPSPGETDPAVLESFRKAREDALEGVLAKSGRLGPSIQSPARPSTARQAGEQLGSFAGTAIARVPSGTPTAPGAPSDPGNPFKGVDPDSITFDMDTGAGAFGSQIESARLTPQQESQITSYLSARSGDPNFNPAEFQAFTQSLGIQGDLSLPEETVKAIREGKPFGQGVDYSAADEAKRRAALEASYKEIPEGGDVSAAGRDKGLLLNMTDEMRGGVGGIKSLLSGDGFMSGYERERDIERALQERSRKENGVWPELAGGLMTPASVLGRAQTVGQFARQGAGMGAVAGFGEGEGASDSLQKAGIGATVGGAVGGVLSQAPKAVNAVLQTQTGQKATGALSKVLERTRPGVDADVIAAGERQGIKVRLPDAVEGKRPALAALEKTKTGAPKVAAAKAEDITAAQNRLGEISPAGGQARDETQLGKILQSALGRQNDTAKAQTSALFQRVERMAPGARSDGAATLSHIDSEIARLKSTGARGNASAIKALEDMRADIADTGITVEALQSLRASIRQRVRDNNLDASASDRLFGGVDKAATADLEKALGAIKPNAVAAFRRANQSHAERLAFRKEVARELLGTPNNPLDAEKAATRLMSKIGSKGDEEGFGRVWATLDDAERADTAATILHQIGGGDEFSLAKLATGLENANERTLRTVFGKDGAEALRDIRLIARRKTQTQRGLNNSNTGSVVEEKGNTLLDTILGVFGYTQGGPLGAAVAVGSRAVGEKVGNSWRARLLLNPDFTKWLRQVPNTKSPEVINRYFDRLNKIASREQAFLMDARQLQDYLRSAASQTPGRAAAESQQEEDRR